MNITPSSDEKIMAALAHGSVFLMFLGPVVPVILWAAQRKKSKYVSFQALQAMGYQMLTFWLGIFIMILIAVFVVFLMPLLGILMKSLDDMAIAPFLFQFSIFITIFGLMGLIFVTGMAGGIACLLGRDFRYPVLGNWLGRYLAYNANPESQIIEAQEDNWVAGVCHATAILQMWGLVTPLIVWFSQKERSARLRFQSMQAFVYQLIALVAYVLGTAAYMAFFFGMLFSLMLSGAMQGGKELQDPPAILMVSFFGILLLFWLVIMILVPIYHLLAGFAGLRVIRGHHFRYPILGKIIEKRMETAHLPAMAS